MRGSELYVSAGEEFNASMNVFSIIFGLVFAWTEDGR